MLIPQILKVSFSLFLKELEASSFLVVYRSSKK